MSVGASIMKKSKLKPKPFYWNDAVYYLSCKDKVISEIISRHGSNNFLVKSKSIFKTLFKIIVGQQISIEAAKSIEDKINRKVGKINAMNLLNFNDHDLRSCGLSYRKVEYIKDIALLYLKDKSFFLNIKNLNDNEAIKKLVSIRGIGPWSAEMFLIFKYNRANILPLADIGLINSFCKNYSIDKSAFIREISVYQKIWQPYCTVATWYLWRDIDEDVVQY